MSNYQRFAQVYDEVMEQTTYLDWLNFTEQSIKAHADHPVQRILELACGTGQVALRLAECGFDVIGLDLSDNMLSLAQQKAQECGVAIQWIADDMCQFQLDQTVDVVTCYSDSLCYLLEEEQVQQVFQSVFNALKEGGLFLFDVHSTYQMTEVFPGYQYIYNTPELIFNWESFEYDLTNSVEHVITMLLPDGEKKEQYIRHEEVHVERSLEQGQYVSLLKAVGFKYVNVLGDFGRSKVTTDTPRWFFICKK